jgi:hypothetical protein
MNIWPGVVLVVGILAIGTVFALYALFSDRRRHPSKKKKGKRT